MHVDEINKGERGEDALEELGSVEGTYDGRYVVRRRDWSNRLGVCCSLYACGIGRGALVGGHRI